MSLPTTTLAETEGTRQTISSPSINNYAFLVHSQDTLPNNIPPYVDNKPLARMKRRRTSPEDQAILEAEYQKNSKPDKAARMDIVRRVALGEREVQIWFQNRRQNSRRKSKPLEAHELLRQQASAAQAMAEDQPPPPEDDPEPPIDIDAADTGPRANDPSQSSFLSNISNVSGQSSNIIGAGVPTSTPLSSQENPQGASNAMGYLANRRSASFLRRDSSGLSFEANVQQEFATQSAPGLKKSSSKARLSLTSDGNARIITKDDMTPSPPRSQPTAPTEPMPELRRSNSMSLTDKLKRARDSSLHRELRRTASGNFGRSTDSRAWEFWCDKEQRDALAEKAEQEQSGSAAAAIGLLRSQSARSVLRPNPNKRNAQLTRQGSNKRPRLDQSVSASHIATKSKASATVASKKLDMSWKESDGNATDDTIELITTESDKENWEPGTSQRGRKEPGDHGSSATTRQVLQENSKIMSQSTSLGAMMAQEKPKSSPSKRRKVRNAGSAEVRPDDDDEIARFMGSNKRSGSARNSISSEEQDLDCIQGLLSLSQGNWK